MSYYDDASLVLIPSGVNTSKVYSQKPTDGTGDLTFSRASIATRTNSAGLIEKVRTNLITYSEQFNNAAWTTSSLNVSVSSNVVSAPNGTNTADLIVANAITSNTIYVRNSLTLPSTGIYTFSVYAKKQNQNTIGLRSLSAGLLINYDLDAGTSTGGFIQNVGGGWFRIGFSYTAASTSESIYIYPLGTGTRTGNGVDGVYVWGAQLETGDIATDYIPTTTAAVTVGPTNNVPRLDYSGGATCPRLLLEPQRTNLVLYSEQFDNAFWLKGNASTISANATTSPDGTLSADKHVSANNGVAFALGWTNASVVSGTVYTFSVYLKRSEVRFVQLRNNISGNLFCNFDLELGVAGTPSAGLTASISNAGSGWYRCVITSTSGGTATAGFLINMANSITDGLAPTYIGNGVNGYFVWGAQVEVGSYVSSYIPTTTAAVTRLADTASKTGVSSLIGQQEGVVYWEGILPQESTIGSTGEVGMFNTERQPATRTALTLMHRANTGAVFARLFIGNGTLTPIINLNIGGFASGTFAKIAFAYKSGDSALYINGIQRATSSVTYTSVTTMNDINFNDNVVVYGYTSQQSVAQALLFKTRLTNAQLAQLTTL